MKKALIGLSLFVVLTVISVFVFIPTQLHISETTVMNANTNALFRYLSDESKWNKWWPGESKEKQWIGENNYPKFNKFTYHLTKKLYNAVNIEILKKGQTINGKIFIIPLAEDSLIVRWQSAFTTSFNPYIRILQYNRAVNIKKNMGIILNSLKSFSEDKEKVYKFHIHHTTLKDTLLVAIKTVKTNYPSTFEIYQLIQNLRTYIAAQKAREVDSPILNITKKDSSHFEIMAAIPTDKTLNGKGNIALKRMIPYKDKILTADVKGGPEKIKEAYDELNTYIKDYNLTSPVIPWETLVTDRSKETDSTKWITKICIPIV